MASSPTAGDQISETNRVLGTHKRVVPLAFAAAGPAGTGGRSVDGHVCSHTQITQFSMATVDCRGDQVAGHIGGDVRGLCWRLGYAVRP